MPSQKINMLLRKLPKLLQIQGWRQVFTTRKAPLVSYWRHGIQIANITSHPSYTLAPYFQVTPKFLAENKYQLPVDNTHTAYQMVHNTDLPAFIHAMMTLSPERLQNFGLWMQANKAALPQWLDTVPFEKLCDNKDPAKAIFVDIGGSIGHQSVAVKAKYPDLPGRIIYQDLPPVVAHGLQVPGVESMVYDFFQEQPIKGKSAEPCFPFCAEQSVFRCASLLLPQHSPRLPWREMSHHP